MAGIVLGPQVECGEGKTPSVAINEQGVIVVAFCNAGNLECQVGQLNSEIHFSERATYAKGTYPWIAINKHNVIVEVHKALDDDTLWYTVGTVEMGHAVSWGECVKYDDGTCPKVSLNDQNTLVAVHQSQALDTLWHYVGKVNPHTKTVLLPPYPTHYRDGNKPMVALNNNNQIVEVHCQSSTGVNFLRYMMGEVDIEGGSLKFINDVRFDGGLNPVISLNNSGNIMEIHQRPDGLFYSTGSLKTGLSASKRLGDEGRTPCIAMNNVPVGIIVLQSGTFKEPIWKYRLVYFKGTEQWKEFTTE